MLSNNGSLSSYERTSYSFNSKTWPLVWLWLIHLNWLGLDYFGVLGINCSVMRDTFICDNSLCPKTLWLRCSGLITWTPKSPNPTHGSKSQHGGKGPTFEPQETIKKWLMIIKVKSWLFWAKTCAGVVLRVGSSFLLDPLSTQVPSLNVQKVLPCRPPCHTWDLGLGTPCEIVSPNFQALNGWDGMDWPQVTWDLRHRVNMNYLPMPYMYIDYTHILEKGVCVCVWSKYSWCNEHPSSHTHGFLPRHQNAFLKKTMIIMIVNIIITIIIITLLNLMSMITKKKGRWLQCCHQHGLWCCFNFGLV